MRFAAKTRDIAQPPAAVLPPVAEPQARQKSATALCKSNPNPEK
jgi:hypothetical protein